ncbi:MAG: twin-arginine translocation signal domain-containing protein [Gemmatimonadetes bacterium]|nr:twin-arginine translocation signal domain-containing protein [Gemmatimonadota bacterium]
MVKNNDGTTRRDFLKATGVAVGVAGAWGWPFPTKSACRSYSGGSVRWCCFRPAGTGRPRREGLSSVVQVRYPQGAHSTGRAPRCDRRPCPGGLAEHPVGGWRSTAGASGRTQSDRVRSEGKMNQVAWFAPRVFLVLVLIGLTLLAHPRHLQAQAVGAGQGSVAPAQEVTTDADYDHESAPRVRAIRVQTSIDIDGRLDEPVWMQAPAITEFIQEDPAEGEPGTQRTEFRVAYDDDAIYIGAMLYDSFPITTRLARRDPRRRLRLHHDQSRQLPRPRDVLQFCSESIALNFGYGVVHWRGWWRLWRGHLVGSGLGCGHPGYRSGVVGGDADPVQSASLQPR